MHRYTASCQRSGSVFFMCVKNGCCLLSRESRCSGYRKYAYFEDKKMKSLSCSAIDTAKITKVTAIPHPFLPCFFSVCQITIQNT